MSMTQVERSDRSERALLNAAVDIIAERGYDGATLAAIGEAAGYSRGLVTQRFGSKEALLWTVVERMVEAWGSQWLRPAVADASGVESLRRWLSAYADAVRQRPKQVRCLNMLLAEAMGPLPSLRPKFAQLHRDQEAAIAAVIRDGVRDGSLRTDLDVPRQAGLFLSMIRGTTLQWLVDPEHVDLTGLLEEYSASLDRQLGR